MITTLNSRLIVIHEAFNTEIMRVITNNDILFFDDCLYSQYIFIKSNYTQLLEKNVKCVLGFSTGIYRHENTEPLYRAICKNCHDKIHNNIDVTNAYMTISELKELLEYKNIYLAAHGHMHLELEYTKSFIEKTQLFIDDCDIMFNRLKYFDLYTDIFIFPYAYDNIIGCYNFLKKNGITQFFAGKDTRRIEIEKLLENQSTIYTNVLE